MIALLVVVIVAGSTALAVRAARTDDPRRRHPSTGGAHRPNPPRQPCHVRMIRPAEELDR